MPVRPLSIRRIIGTAIAVALASTALYFAIETYRYSRQLEGWDTAEPVSVDVDLSQRGVIEAPFAQTCHTAHGESILLRIADATPSPDGMLQGLKAKIEILDQSGKVVVDTSLPRPDEIPPASAEDPELAHFRPFEDGRYTLRLSVEKPAPALAGHKQHLYARYQLCGLEGLPVLVGGAIAILSGIPALIIGGFTAKGLIRHGWRAAPGR